MGLAQVKKHAGTDRPTEFLHHLGFFPCFWLSDNTWQLERDKKKLLKLRCDQPLRLLNRVGEMTVTQRAANSSASCHDSRVRLLCLFTPCPTRLKVHPPPPPLFCGREKRQASKCQTPSHHYSHSLCCFIFFVVLKRLLGSLKRKKVHVTDLLKCAKFTIISDRNLCMAYLSCKRDCGTK